MNNGILPSSLTHLTFSNNSSFNQQMGQNTLPNGLVYLQLGKIYNKPIGKNVLPDSLQKIVLGKKSQELLILNDKFKSIINYY